MSRMLLTCGDVVTIKIRKEACLEEEGLFLTGFRYKRLKGKEAAI
jgi:hypothetical protein